MLMSMRKGLHHEARAGSILANCTSSISVFLTCITNTCRCRWWGRWGRTMFTQCCRRWIPRTHCGKSRSVAPSKTAAASRCCAFWTSWAPNGARTQNDNSTGCVTVAGTFLASCNCSASTITSVLRIPGQARIQSVRTCCAFGIAAAGRTIVQRCHFCETWQNFTATLLLNRNFNSTGHFLPSG